MQLMLKYQCIWTSNPLGAVDPHIIIGEKSRARECKGICPGNLSSQDCIFLSLLFTLLIYTNHEEGLAELTKIKGENESFF